MNPCMCCSAADGCVFRLVPTPGCHRTGPQCWCPSKEKRHGVGFWSIWVWVCPEPLDVHSHCKKVGQLQDQHLLHSGYHHPNQAETSPSSHSPSRPAHGGWSQESQPHRPEMVPQGPGLVLSFSTIKQVTNNNCNICYVQRVMSFPTVMVQCTMIARVMRRRNHIRI